MPFSRALEALLTLGVNSSDVDGELLTFLHTTLVGEDQKTPNVTIPEADDILSSFFSINRDLDPATRANLVGAVLEAFCSPTLEEESTEKKNFSLKDLGGGGGPTTLPASEAPPLTFTPPLHLAGTVDSLLSLFPDLDSEGVCLSLERCGSTEVSRAAAWLLEGDNALQMAAAARASRERRQRASLEHQRAAMEEEKKLAAVNKGLRARYGEREEIDPSLNFKPSLPAALGEGAVKKGVTVKRYVDGNAVYLKPGEKFLVEKPPPDQFLVSIKVKKKGQGGASPSFK
jgi:hypothetical protein